MTNQEIQNSINAQQSIILDREMRLKADDYKNTKNGEAQRAEQPMPYDPVKLHALHQGWRDEINAAEAEIARLEALIPEEEPMEAMEIE